MKTIDEVHAHGVRLSMDDFGTGYSSLSYLRLPVSELKLDRSFVADLEHDEAARALSSAILGIGKSLHLTVVAEGVETATQNVMLREQGYPVAQGFLFSRPLSPQDLEQWLIRRQAEAPAAPVAQPGRRCSGSEAAGEGPQPGHFCRMAIPRKRPKWHGMCVSIADPAALAVAFGMHVQGTANGRRRQYQPTGGNRDFAGGRRRRCAAVQAPGAGRRWAIWRPVW
jgi:hypothetical protein